MGSGVKNFFRNSELEKDDLLLFYFAGHGYRDSEDGKLYFAMADSIKTSLETSALDCAHLKNLMEKSASEKQLIILDSCFSGGFGDARRGVDEFELHTEDLINQKGRYVISASDKFEYSYEQLGSDNTFKNSIFTHALIDGIQSGEAVNTTGALTAESIFKYVRAKVKDATNAKQIPKRFIYQGDDDLVLVVSNHQSIPNDLLQELNSTDHDECLVALIKLKHDHLHDENYHKAAGFILEAKLNHRDYYVRSEANELYLRIKNHKQNSQPKAVVSKGFDNLFNHSYQKKTNKVQAPELILSKLQPGEVFQDKLKIGGLGPKMVIIPGGEFLMGSPENERGRDGDEGPQHRVTVNSFAMGETAVTFNDYEIYCNAVGKALPDDSGWGKENQPVINVSWNDATEYVQWLNEQTGRTYRLPNEAQWEYACRAGTTTAYNTGATITAEQANFDGKNSKSVPVKSYLPNKFGLYEMHGNVWEWCEDNWHSDYKGAPSDGTAWIVERSGAERVLRGGSWLDYERNLRSSSCNWLKPGRRSFDVGLRLSLDL